MNKWFSLILISFIFSCASPSVSAWQLISINLNEVTVCPVVDNTNRLPTFNEPNCQRVSAHKINPQRKAIWVKATIELPEPILLNLSPYSIYISGKTSSEVYFNGEFIGNNGKPAIEPKNEVAGKIDAAFYLSPQHLKKTNQLILKLSAHHGFLTLSAPVNFIGFGAYADSDYFVHRNLSPSLIPLGALVLAAIYFLVASFSPQQRKTNLLFLAMTSLAVLQLLAEISRALFSYDYPLHDLRLLAIVLFAYGFGICLLSYIVLKLSLNRKTLWIGLSSALTLLFILFTPGFDNKTAIAILLPSGLCTLLLVIKSFKLPNKEHLLLSLVFGAFCVTILFTFTRFHDSLFYYIITSVLIVLFIQQALKLNSEQKQRQLESAQMEKLQFTLEQNQQKIQPQKIKISSAGKIELIASDKIAFCKAAGDYVEINLSDKKQVLFSGNLKQIEALLPSTFLRVHRSYLVNTHFISSLLTKTSSGYLLLEGEFEVPVSRRIMPKVRGVVGES